MNDASHDRAERGARLVAAGIIVSRVAGLVRNSLFTMLFARGIEADAYAAATRIPNVLRNLLGEGAVSASFVPVYAAALERGDERGARALANALLGVLLAGVSILTIIGVVASPLLARAIVGGFDPAKLELTTQLMRVLFPMTGLMVLSGWCLGVQNANRRFFMAYASAAAWSAAQIAAMAFGWYRATDPTTLIWWVSWATLAGSVLQIAAQLPQVVRLMGAIAPTLNAGAPGLRETLSNFLPVVSALGVFQLSSLIDLSIASYLPAGSAASLTYATQIYLLPLSLFGVANAAAALPELARLRERGDTAAIGVGVSRAWERVIFYTIPSAIAFVAIGDFIVGTLYRGKHFGADDQFVVYVVLAAYALGLAGYASARVFASSYQAAGDYRTPLRAAMAGVFVSAAGAALLALPFRNSELAVAGIGVGSAVGAYVNLGILWYARARIGEVPAVGPMRVLRGALMAAIFAAITTVPFRLALAAYPLRVTAAVIILSYCFVFLWAAKKFKLEEADRLLGRVRALLATRR